MALPPEPTAVRYAYDASSSMFQEAQITSDARGPWAGNFGLNTCRCLRVLDITVEVEGTGQQIEDVSTLLNTIPQVNLVQEVNLELLLELDSPHDFQGFLDARWDHLGQEINRVSLGRAFRLFICLRSLAKAPGKTREETGMYLLQSLDETLKPWFTNTSLAVVLYIDPNYDWRQISWQRPADWRYVFYVYYSELP